MADMIKFRCKACEKKIAVRAEYAGKKAKCPGCKAPVRIPSPRPKRSKTGSPIAVGGDQESSSDQSGSEMTLAELVAMEERADAQIRHMYPKSPSGPSAPRIKGGKDCPDCGSPLKKDAVICVHCGHNIESGKKIKTQKESKLGNAMRSVASAVGQEDGKGTSDILKYAVPTIGFFIAAMLAYTGAISAIADSIPIKLVQDLKDMYESMGSATAGTILLGFSAISGLIWYLMKR